MLLGIQPAVTFNRPIDPSTVTGSAGGVQLLQGTQAVPADVTVLGTTVQLVPRASLLPGLPGLLRYADPVAGLTFN